MCKKLTVAYGDYIGSRMVGWCVFNGKDYGFISDKAVKARISQGDLVNGLTLDEEKNVAIDKTFTKSLMGKSGMSFNPITAADDIARPAVKFCVNEIRQNQGWRWKNSADGGLNPLVTHGPQWRGGMRAGGVNAAAPVRAR